MPRSEDLDKLNATEQLAADLPKILGLKFNRVSDDDLYAAAYAIGERKVEFEATGTIIEFLMGSVQDKDWNRIETVWKSLDLSKMSLQCMYNFTTCTHLVRQKTYWQVEIPTCKESGRNSCGGASQRKELIDCLKD